MPHLARRYTAALLVLIALLLPLWYLADFGVELWQHKQQIRRQLVAGRTQQFRWPAAQVQLKDEGKEAVYDGQYVDILHYQAVGDTLIIEGVPDHREISLRQHFRQQWRPSPPAGSPQPRSLGMARWLGLHWFYQPTALVPAAPGTGLSALHMPGSCPPWVRYLPGPPTPPPRHRLG
ncbi:MAG: hypothetical protein MUF62_13265 [Chitinophagaceae bacterium]|nr:hypothetical protein [Chitinophagaceae bacterium]